MSGDVMSSKGRRCGIITRFWGYQCHGADDSRKQVMVLDDEVSVNNPCGCWSKVADDVFKVVRWVGDITYLVPASTRLNHDEHVNAVPVDCSFCCEHAVRWYTRECRGFTIRSRGGDHCRRWDMPARYREGFRTPRPYFHKRIQNDAISKSPGAWC